MQSQQTYLSINAEYEAVLPTRWRWKAERRYDIYSSYPQQATSSPLPFTPDIVHPMPVERTSAPPSPRDASVGPTPPTQPRRSTRQPGLVKNPYIVREANNLKAARNRVYALIDACDEAKRASEAAKALRMAAEDGASSIFSGLPQHLFGSVRSGSQTPTKRVIKKRKRGDLEIEDRYEHAYGYGEKDGEDMDMENELNKEYDEIVSKLWVEGPASTGAVVAYLKARSKLLKVVDIVHNYEAYKAKHNIQGADLLLPKEECQEMAPPAEKTTRRKPVEPPRDGTPIRRSARARVPVQTTRGQPAQADDQPPKRKHRKKVPVENPEAPVAPVARGRKPRAVKREVVKSQSRATSQAESSLSEDSNASTESQIPVSAAASVATLPSEPSLPVIQHIRSSARQTRQVKTADNSPLPVTATLPTMPPPALATELVSRLSDSRQTRASSHPALSASSDVGPRLLRSRSKLALPTRFDEYVPTTVHT